MVLEPRARRRVALDDDGKVVERAVTQRRFLHSLDPIAADVVICFIKLLVGSGRATLLAKPFSEMTREAFRKW